MKARLLLIAYAFVNAVLYSVLLPLWEGFDEPFHFAYVQQLGDGQGLPDARTARLSREVEASILLAPASQAVKQNLPQVTVIYSVLLVARVEKIGSPASVTGHSNGICGGNPRNSSNYARAPATAGIRA